MATLGNIEELWLEEQNTQANEVCVKLELEQDDKLSFLRENEKQVVSDLELASRQIKSEDSMEYSEEAKTTTAYSSFSVKTYTSTILKQEPMNEINKIFMESNLEYEINKFHQQILEDIVINFDQIKLKDLQEQYITRLHGVANIEVFNCSFCSYQTMNMKNLTCHLLIIHNEKTEHEMFRCSQRKCNFKTSTLLSMKRHSGHHRKEDVTFKCNMCGYIGPSSPALKKHKLKHRETFLKCDLCLFQTKDYKAIKEHKSTHICHETNKYKCYQCEYTIKRKMKLAKHLSKVHQIQNKRAEQIKVLYCNLCEYKTDTKDQLKLHSLQHKNPEEIEYFHCNICAFKTKFKKSLRDHKTTHLDSSEKVKTKMCEICSYKCSKPSDLHRHLLTHKSITEVSENDIHHCPKPGCGYKSKAKSNLTHHLVSHKEPMFFCDTCGYKAKRKVNYEQHMLRHKKPTEVEIFKCFLCPYQTRMKRNLEKHMKMGDHTGKNLKHIPIRFRVENTDIQDSSSN